MIDRTALSNAVARHGRVARVVIAAIAGSSPREVGASMLVWPDGQSGTIGGGALEFQASETARRHLRDNAASRLSRHALGPELGQCCGGAVTLLTEIFEADALDHMPATGLFARGPGDRPFSVTRAEALMRNSGITPEPALHGDWFVEPIAEPDFHLWIWGAGHVGRALVDVLAPLPGIVINWVDTDPGRFPETCPDNATPIPAANPALLVPHAPKDAHHLILTYSHALDLDLCHAVLGHGFASAGLIGSATKWARFQSHLRALGHSNAQIARVTCPIGDPALGKHPQAIAVGVAARYLEMRSRQTAQREKTA